MISVRKSKTMKHLITEYFSKQPKSYLILLGFLLVLLIGVLDYVTGSEISVGVLYLFPISLVTWFVDRRIGILISILSALTSLVDDSMTGEIYSHILYWNKAALLCFFLVFTAVLSVLKNAIEREKKVARIDDLTGIANRRSFYESAKIEISRASRYKHSFTVAYMDIDNFKFVNDRFGHSTGDSLLQLVAEVTRNNIRASDVVARLGGDEYAILLSETGYDSAHLVMGRIQKSLLGVMEKNGWPVTFSFGVVTFITPPNSVDEIVRRIDEVMYLVKNRGKDSSCYVIFPERGIQNKEEI
jgi:diguanylate cyclase (GGDEF)-like protein